MLMEIRSFVAKYNIRQNMLAEMTGISQGYISRFFRGEGQDISERARNLIYSWYLNFRRNPTKILQCCPMTVGDRKMISETGDLLPIRRDRFIFRKQHLQVLEQYFAENPYPDSHTKEQIAEECNQAAERISSKFIGKIFLQTFSYVVLHFVIYFHFLIVASQRDHFRIKTKLPPALFLIGSTTNAKI